MSWSGGTYTKSNAGTGGWTGDAVAGIAIDATRHDTQDNDFAAGINQCLTKDGQNSCTADLNFGGFRPSNVAGGSAAAPAYTANNDTDTGAFSPAANAYAIATGGVERVRVDSSGYVGIGTIIPDRPLVVSSAGNGLAAGESSLMVVGQSNKERITCRTYGAGAPVFLGQTASGTLASPTAATIGQSLGYLGGAGYHSGGAFSSTAVGVNLGAAENFTSTAQGTFISFETVPTGSTVRAERMRVTGSGKVGIGTTTPFASLDVASSLQIGASGTATNNFHLTAESTGALQFWNGNYGAGTERMRISSAGDVLIGATATSGTSGTVEYMKKAGGTTWQHGPATAGTGNSFYVLNSSDIGVRLDSGNTSWTANSDARQKKNIQDLEYGLNQIKGLRPVRFDYLTEESNDSKRIGFIAQEVLPHVPEAVSGSEQTSYGLATAELIPVLVAAVKELTAKVEALEAELAILKGV